jgi:hypothetical protein
LRSGHIRVGDIRCNPRASSLLSSFAAAHNRRTQLLPKALSVALCANMAFYPPRRLDPPQFFPVRAQVNCKYHALAGSLYRFLRPDKTL